MSLKPEILRGSKGIEVIHSSSTQVTLRQPLFPFYPRLVFGAICGTVFILIYFFWRPESWLDTLLMLLCLGVFIYFTAALCFNAITLTVTSCSLKWNYSPLPLWRGGQIEKRQIEAITFKSLNHTTIKRAKAHSLHSIGVRGVEKEQIIIFPLMQSAWTAEMTSRVIAGYLGDLPVESD